MSRGSLAITDVGHVVEALVDDLDRLADLVDADQVAASESPSSRVGMLNSSSGRRCRMGPPDVEWHARSSQVAARDAVAESRGRSRTPTRASANEDLVLVEERRAGFDFLCRATHPVAQAAHELVVEIAVDPPIRK